MLVMNTPVSPPKGHHRADGKVNAAVMMTYVDAQGQHTVTPSPEEYR